MITNNKDNEDLQTFLLDEFCVAAAATAAKFPVAGGVGLVNGGGGWWWFRCPEDGELLFGVECDTDLLLLLDIGVPTGPTELTFSELLEFSIGNVLLALTACGFSTTCFGRKVFFSN